MDSHTDDLLLERQLCFGLSVASRAVVGAYKPVLAALGLTHPQYLVMLALWEQSPRTVKDLSAALMLEPATLSPLLKRLEAAGMLVRRRSTADERALDVDLTDHGRALYQRALSVPGTMMERLGLSREQAQALHGSMMELIASATRAPATLPAPGPDTPDPSEPTPAAPESEPES